MTIFRQFARESPIALAGLGSFFLNALALGLAWLVILCATVPWFPAYWWAMATGEFAEAWGILLEAAR